MLIIGAGGFAKQLIEIVDQLNLIDQITLFDDISIPQQDYLYDRIPVMHSEALAIEKFQNGDKRFVLGVGNPVLRHNTAERFRNLGGLPETLISPKAIISRFSTVIAKGSTLLSNVIVEGNVAIGEGTLINLAAVVTHDCIIGNYVEICPGVKIGGRCTIGSFTSIGSGAVIIPNIVVGNNVIIAAGSVVTKDIPDNVMVAGVPATIKKDYCNVFGVRFFSDDDNFQS